MAKTRRTVLIVFLIIAPFVFLTLLGRKAARDDSALTRVRFDALLSTQLDVIAAAAGRVLDETERDLTAAIRGIDPTPEALRVLAASVPSVRNTFLLDKDGKLLFPRNDASSSEDERAFATRLAHLLNTGQQFRQTADAGVSTLSTGRHVRYDEEGLRLIFWQQLEGGRVIGVELSRMALLANIVGSIDSGLPSGIDPNAVRVVLTDESGRPVYGFGGYDPPPEATPRVSRALDAPLGALTLRFFIALGAAGDRDKIFAHLGLLAGIGALFIVIVLGTVYYLRETGRDLKEAAERVTFVNRVSHELKTPLTNIRMYAELLEMDLDETDASAKTHVNVIIQESRRLSRLIGNVLTFGRGMRKQLTLHRAPGVVDDIVRETVLQFEPSLNVKAVAVQLDLQAPSEVLVDADAAAQILGNLLSNVEKYAADGGRVDIRTRRVEDTTVLVVSDRGPGIPESARTRIFEPFFRVSDNVNEGAAGTGIGLAIARDLARLHGGDLTLSQSDVGACFQLVLETPITRRSDSRLRERSG